MKQFTGRIVGYTETSVDFVLPCGAKKTLRASEAVRRQAISHLGRTVRFEAQLSEQTESLAAPVLVVGSSAGLRVVEHHHG